MQKVIICQGLPGSGKSTWAKEFVEKNSNYVRVNRDDLRNMRGKYWLPSQEDMITNWELELMLNALNRGFNVINDSTNLNPKHLKNMLKYIEDNKTKEVEISYQDFTTVPLKTCIERDLKRPNSVGEKVIRRMYYKHILKVEKYKPDESLESAIICDLDGTLALFYDKNPYERDFIKDTLNRPVAEILDAYGGQVFLFSGRSGKYLDETSIWLRKHKIVFHTLRMRAIDDNRSDFEVKKEMFDTLIKDKYKIDFVIDDRPQVIQLWRSLGLFVFDVNQSGEDF